MVYLSNRRCTEYRRRDLSLSSYDKGLIPVMNLVNDLCTLSILLRVDNIGMCLSAMVGEPHGDLRIDI